MTAMRIGMVGLDTSHVPAFVRLMNDVIAQPAGHEVRIVAAFPAGNPDFPLSRDRVDGFTEEVRAMGVRLVDSLEELLTLVDGVMVQSVDGRQHLEQARAVFAAGKPVFIDKPLAASLTDVRAIEALGRTSGVPWFTASSTRFSPGYPDLKCDANLGRILGCEIYSQCKVMPGHPDLFWYGVHGVDLLYSLLGTGCRAVSAFQTEFTEQVTGVWQDGRIGTYRGIREETGATGLGATVFGSTGIVHVNSTYSYESLVQKIADFFRTGQSPVPPAEMVEVFAFMAAAEESKRLGGIPVLTEAVIAAAGRED